MNEVNEIIAICDNKKVVIIDIKNKIKLDGSFQSSIMANLHSMFAQMERQLISERTKQGLLLAKQKGNLIGRNRGIKKNKLDGKEEEIKNMISEKISYRQNARKLNVDYSQLMKFIRNKVIKCNTI